MMLETKYGRTKRYDAPLFINPHSSQEAFSVVSIDETGIFVLNSGMYE